MNAEKKLYELKLAEKEILKEKEKYKDILEPYLEKKPVTLTELEPQIKEEFEKLNIKYVKKMPFMEKIDVLANKNSELALKLLNDYDFSHSTQLRMKPKKMTFEDALNNKEIRQIYKNAKDIVNSDELNFIKISLLNAILKQISLESDNLKEEILKNYQKNGKIEFFSVNDLLKLNNKKSVDQLDIYGEKISKDILKNDEAIKELGIIVKKNKSLVVYSPFNSLKEIKELFNVNKQRTQINKNLNNSKFGLI